MRASSMGSPGRRPAGERRAWGALLSEGPGVRIAGDGRPKCRPAPRRRPPPDAPPHPTEPVESAHVDHALRDALAHPKNRASGAHVGPRRPGAAPLPPPAPPLTQAAEEAAAGASLPAPLPTRPPRRRRPVAVLRLEAEVEAFVLQSEEPQHVFGSDMSSYEVGAAASRAACSVWPAAAGTTLAPGAPLGGSARRPYAAGRVHSRAAPAAVAVAVQ